MSRYTLDASVAIKWLIPEESSPQAVRLLARTNSFLAPDLIYGEVGNVLWKRARRGEITSQYAISAFNTFNRLDIEAVASAKMTPLALGLALSIGCAVYDAYYLVIAMERECPLVTADKALHGLTSKAGLGQFIVLIGA